MRYCQECGNQCNLDMKFCPKCGTKLVEIEELKEQQTQEIQSNENKKDNQIETQPTLNKLTKEDDFQQVNSNNVENHNLDDNIQNTGVIIETPVSNEYKNENKSSWVNDKTIQVNNTSTQQNGSWNYTGESYNNINTINNDTNKTQFKKHVLGIISLVLGMISGAYWFVLLLPVLFGGVTGVYDASLILSIIGVIFGVLGIKNSKAISIVGIIINVIVIFLSILLW